MKASTVKGIFAGAVAVAAGVILIMNKSTSTTTSNSPRQLVARAALSQLGNDDPKRYWDDVLPGVNPGGADWCGAGALWCLHQAGLALDRHWIIGSGFLLTPPELPMTKQPKVGDIAYFDHLEHEAVVVGVEPGGGAVSLVNFNGVGGRVSRSTIAPAQATAFFSIEPLLNSRANV